MILRKATPSASYLPTPSPEISPRSSALISDCDADDEGTMSIEDSTPSRPLTIAITHPTTNSYCPRRPTLPEVLANSSPPPWTLSAFTAYLSQNHCLENLEFTMDAERYRKKYDLMAAQMAGMPVSPDFEDCQYLRMLWQRLLDAYIEPDGPREVNLPSNVRDSLLSLPNHTAPPPPDELEAAIKIIYDLMDESVLPSFLNETSSFTGPRSYVDPWVSSEESMNMGVGRSLDERSSRRNRSRRRRQSPKATSLDGVSIPVNSGLSPISPMSNLVGSLGKGGKTASSKTPAGRTPTRARNISNSSGDSSLTDDSGSASSPGKEPMTPPTTPPSSDIGGSSPRSRHDNTWTRMTRNLGLKKKSFNGMRDHRFPTLEDE